LGLFPWLCPTVSCFNAKFDDGHTTNTLENLDRRPPRNRRPHRRGGSESPELEPEKMRINMKCSWAGRASELSSEIKEEKAEAQLSGWVNGKLIKNPAHAANEESN